MRGKSYSMQDYLEMTLHVNLEAIWMYQHFLASLRTSWRWERLMKSRAWRCFWPLILPVMCRELQFPSMEASFPPELEGFGPRWTGTGRFQITESPTSKLLELGGGRFCVI